MITTAIENNIIWCDLILKNTGRRTILRSEYWINTEQSLPLYPDLITRTKKITPETVGIIKALSQGSYVKDSFNKLDLVPLGYQKLFTNTWLTLNLNSEHPIQHPHNIAQHSIDIPDKVTCETDLKKWKDNWNANTKIANQIFPSRILNCPDVSFLYRTDQGKITAGAVINKGPQKAVGISNTYGKKIHLKPLINGIKNTYHDCSIVTYTGPDDINLYLELGFQECGQLSIWGKNKVL